MKKILIPILVLLLSLISVSATLTENTTLSGQITALKYSSQAWGDYNNDGNFDLAICGTTGEDYNTIIYKANVSASTVFTKQDFNIINVTECSLSFGHINSDDYIDLVIAGRYHSNNSNFITSIYINNNGTDFTNTQNLTGLKFPTTNFADIDNDNDLDLITTGCNQGTDSVSSCTLTNSSIYTNIDGTLTYNSTWSQNLVQVWKGSVAIADYDNDGDVDLAMIGTTESNQVDAITKIYINNETSFNEDTTNSLEGVYWGSIAWYDFDEDTDVDLFISGRNESNTRVTKIFTSDTSLLTSNTQPSAPNSLSSSYANGTLNITWSDGYDTETQSGLYYNLKAGSNSTNNNIVSSKYPVSSNPTQGYFGNMLQRKTKLLNLPERCVFYSVQTIDAGLYSSDFSTVQNISFNETCDTYDNDCDLNEDEGFDQNQNGSIDWNETFDHDGDGYYPQTTVYYNMTCSGYQNYDCDDTDTSINPGIIENSTTKCNDGIDHDCSGSDAVCSDTSSTLGTNGGGGSPTVINQPTDTTPETQESPTDTAPETQESPTISIPESSDSSDSSTVKIEETIEKIKTNRYSYKREIIVKDGRTQITEIIKNIDFLELEDVNIQITIPKDIESKASKLIKIDNFEIIEEDPIINFNIDTIKPINTKRIQYVINKELTRLQTQKITTDISVKEVENREEEIQKQIDETKKYLNLTQEYKINYEENKTEFKIKIDQKETAAIGDVYIYQEIPKCLVEIIREELIESEYDFEIVDVDPLIVWHFDNLLDVDEISYNIKAIADEDCLNKASALAIAKKIVQMNFSPKRSNIFLVLAPIPLVIIILFIFGLFTKEIEHYDPKIQKLISYIKHHYKHGFKEEHLMEKLEKEGYKENEINEATKLNSQNKLHYFLQRLEIGFEELIMLSLIVLNILDFTELLPGDADYVKKIISWTILAFLLFNISITDLILGIRRKWVDALLILSFFSLIMKNMVGFANAAFIETVNKGAIVTDLYAFIIQNNQIFEVYLFIAGIILLTLISLYLSINEDVKAPSFLNILHFHPSKSKNPFKILLRFIITNLTLLAFFIVIFNLVMEWLAIAVDAFILVLTLGFIFFILIKHKEKFTPPKLLYEIEESSEKFYEKFITLFHYKKTLLLGISGMLILHILTELGNFMIPYLTGIHDAIYFGNFNEGHLPIFNIIHSETKSLFAIQSAGLTIFPTILIFLGYILNIIAILYLILLPAFTWYHMFKNRKLALKDIPKIIINKFHIFLSTLSITFSILRPAFIFESLNVKGLVGVDIQTIQLNLTNIELILLSSLASAVIAILISIKFRALIKKLILTTSFAFFTYYIYLFFRNTISYYLVSITELIGIQPIITIYLALFLLINIIFYSFGMLSLLIELYIRKELWFENHRFAVIDYWLRHHHLPHIHHKESHKLDIHGEEEEFLETYIEDAIIEGHNIDEIYHHLITHNWDEKLVQYTISKYEKLIREKALDNLKDKIIENLNNGVLLEDQFKEAKKLGWNDSDLKEIKENIYKLQTQK